MPACAWDDAGNVSCSSRKKNEKKKKKKRKKERKNLAERAMSVAVNACNGEGAKGVKGVRLKATRVQIRTSCECHKFTLHPDSTQMYFFLPS